MSQIEGHVSQIIGPVVDVVFQAVQNDRIILPAIHEALEIARSDGRVLVVEVQQHLGDNTVRTVAMDATDGLSRGVMVKTTGKCITMPSGEQVRGRL
ncbi:MAG TPA: F0F1 ATP synthase subunit beta, partial [Bacteroidales bacterium]|nr:F0F1 ATP synthase subunit beta [Bacteroidales bacterium]